MLLTSTRYYSHYDCSRGYANHSQSNQVSNFQVIAVSEHSRRRCRVVCPFLFPESVNDSIFSRGVGCFTVLIMRALSRVREFGSVLRDCRIPTIQDCRLLQLLPPTRVFLRLGLACGYGATWRSDLFARRERAGFVHSTSAFVRESCSVRESQADHCDNDAVTRDDDFRSCR